MALKPCLACGSLSDQSRCKQHRRKTNTAYRNPEYQRNRTKVLKAWRKQFGELCPGLDEIDHAPHPCTRKNPLTADHIIRVGEGGTHETSNLRPLCRWANSTRG